jgi:hypothetical protein
MDVSVDVGVDVSVDVSVVVNGRTVKEVVIRLSTPPPAQHNRIM